MRGMRSIHNIMRMAAASAMTRLKGMAVHSAAKKRRHNFSFVRNIFDILFLGKGTIDAQT